jgi:hypothetical protein
MEYTKSTGISGRRLFAMAGFSPAAAFDQCWDSSPQTIAERELFAFIGAVTQLFGPEEAKLSAEDWLDASELMDSSP